MVCARIRSCCSATSFDAVDELVAKELPTPAAPDAFATVPTDAPAEAAADAMAAVAAAAAATAATDEDDDDDDVMAGDVDEWFRCVTA